MLGGGGGQPKRSVEADGRGRWDRGLLHQRAEVHGEQLSLINRTMPFILAANLINASLIVGLFFDRIPLPRADRLVAADDRHDRSSIRRLDLVPEAVNYCADGRVLANVCRPWRGSKRRPLGSGGSSLPCPGRFPPPRAWVSARRNGRRVARGAGALYMGVLCLPRSIDFAVYREAGAGRDAQTTRRWRRCPRSTSCA